MNSNTRRPRFSEVYGTEKKRTLSQSLRRWYMNHCLEMDPVERTRYVKSSLKDFEGRTLGKATLEHIDRLKRLVAAPN